MIKKLKFVIIFLIFTVSTFSEIVLTSRERRIDLSEAIEVNVEFKDRDKKQYEIEGIENFQIISRGSSSSYSIINFKRSSLIRDTYILRPNTTGTFTLLVKEGQDSSNSLEIEVVNTGESKEGLSFNEEVPISENYILSEEYPKKNLYFGEKFVYQERFLAFRDLRDLKVNRRVELGDFSAIESTPRGRNGAFDVKNITYQDRNALEIVAYRGILEGNSSGRKLIRSGELEVLGDRRLFLGNREIELEIQPLPTENRPRNFTNVVGDLKLDFTEGRDEIKLGESYTINLKLFGDVNLSLLERVEIQTSSDYSSFQNIKNIMEEIREENYYSEKSFEIAFIPRKSGKITIPEIKINYFNTETEEYSEVVIPSKILEVEGDSLGTTNGTSSSENSERELGSLEESKKENSSVVKIEVLRGENSNELKFYLIGGGVLFLILLQGGLIIYLLKRNKNTGDKDSKSDRKNIKYILKKLKKSKTDEEFYESYCEFMKYKYSFNPKVHSESKILDVELREINREIEISKFKGTELDLKELIKRLEKKST